MNVNGRVAELSDGTRKKVVTTHYGVEMPMLMVMPMVVVVCCYVVLCYRRSGTGDA